MNVVKPFFSFTKAAGILPVAFLLLSLGTSEVLANASATTQARVKRNSDTFGPVWSQNRIDVNVDYRVPLTQAAGFLALNYGDDHAIFDPVMKELRLVQAEANALKKSLTVRGSVFPEEGEAKTLVLRQQIYNSVEKYAGPGALLKLKKHLNDEINGNTFGMRTGSVDF